MAKTRRKRFVLLFIECVEKFLSFAKKDNSVIVPGIYSDKIDLLRSSFEIIKFKSSGFLSSLSHERHSQGKFLELGIMPLTEFRKRIF